MCVCVFGVCLTVERLVASAMLRMVVSLLVVAWRRSVAVLSSAGLVSVQIVTERRKEVLL